MIRQYRLRAILFDMDGVVTDSMSFHFEAWRQAFLHSGIRVRSEEIYEREGQKGSISIREICANHGKKFSDQIAQDILTQKEIIFKKTFRAKFIHGVRSYIKYLRSRGYLLGLVSGTSRAEIEHILPMELIQAFSVIVSGTDVRLGKPHPEPYIKALRSLRLSAEQAIVIENAPLGISSAKAAGLTCLALETSLPRKYLQQADYVFKNFSQLTCFFKRRYKSLPDEIQT